MSRSRSAVSAALTLILCLVCPAGAGATFPGRNGQIAVEDTGTTTVGEGNGYNIVEFSPARRGAPRKVAEGMSAKYSASGRTLLYHFFDGCCNQGIAAVPTAAPREPYWLLRGDPGMVGQKISEEPAPAPDGRRIAFTADLRLSVMNVPSGSTPPEPRLIGKGPYAFCPDWSPDGRSIAYVDYAPRWGSLIGRITPAGRRLPAVFRRRSQQEGCPSWSPDGRLLAFLGGRRAIVIATRGGRVVRRLYVPPLPGELDVPAGFPRPKRPPPLGSLEVAFSPDGRRLAYTPGGRGTYVVSLRTGRRRLACRCGAGALSWRSLPR